MKSSRNLAMLAIAAAMTITFVQGNFNAASAQSAVVEAKPGWYGRIVDAEFVARYAITPKPADVQIIDSRPAARKFDPGHIPTAMNIPDSQFEKLVDKLPGDKGTLLIFYCDGFECMLSHASAFKAEKLGYSNVRVYAAGYPDWIRQGNIGAISVPHLKKLLDASEALTLVDSRPKGAKFDKGHIPGAISIPDSQFDKLVDKLPRDKSSPLYFYCEGLSCKLSSDSAARAVKLGFTNVKVVPEGYPEWARLYGPGPTGEGQAAAPKIESGKDSGTIAVASFERILKEAPDSIRLVDVREPAEFAAGTFKGAINIPINALEKRIDELPSDKPIVFFCGAGGRSGEAQDMAQLYKPALKTFFLDANITWSKDGSFVIKGQ